MKISAVVVVNNDQSIIEDTLVILARSLGDRLQEIIVVDQDSRDMTKTLAKKAAHKIMRDYGIKVIYANDKRRPLRSDSRPLGHNSAEGGWVLHLEAGEFITQEFIDDIPKWLRDPKVRGVHLKRDDGETDNRFFERTALQDGIVPRCRLSEIAEPDYVSIKRWSNDA